MSSGYEEDAQVSGTPSKNKLKEIGALARRQLQLIKKVAAAEAKLETAKAELVAVEQKQLPDAMLEIGLLDFSLTNGTKVMVKNEAYANIKKDDVPAVIRWMDANGHGDLVKRDIKVGFGKGDAKLADALAKFIREKYSKQKWSDASGIHPQTLNAFVREQRAKDKALPSQISIHEVRKAVVVIPKVKAKK